MKKITEDVMIATFLQTEINSNRFRRYIKEVLENLNLNEDIINSPNVTNPVQNSLRKKILSTYRGYNTKQALFDGFPTDITWYEKDISRNLIPDLQYINYSYWIELSNKTRRVNDAVKMILQGKKVFGESNDQFVTAAEAIKKGATFPKIILVSLDEKSTPIILEGHLRATAYALARNYAPEKVDVIIGYSKNLETWSLY